MSINRLILVLLLVSPLASCTSDFCSRHSDCQPQEGCGSAGTCVPLSAITVDASNTDASAADGMASAPDSGSDASLADAGADAMSLPDGGASLFDASLQPPADADPADAMSQAAIPLPGNEGVFVGTGTGDMTVLNDAAGLVP
jgi:hypothetical protein